MLQAHLFWQLTDVDTKTRYRNVNRHYSSIQPENGFVYSDNFKRLSLISKSRMSEFPSEL